MNEDFLHYIWKFQQFATLDLKTSQGESVQVIKTGRHNQNAGPDFLDARIRIGETVWAGNVEIHIAASDWYKHQHDADTAYDNVVLHVVYTNDKEVSTSTGQPIPTLCIKDLFDYQTFRYYKKWIKSARFIPCESTASTVPDIIRISAVQSAAVERLEHKSAFCLDHLYETKGDIEGSFYRILLRSFGLKVNALPFEHLARITPIELVRKNWSESEKLEALFMGQAGFLTDVKNKDPHVQALKNQYDFLKVKYQLTPMPASSWKLFRLRPMNFPQVRLAQVARFYARSKAVSQVIMDYPELERLKDLFDISLVDNFWKTHYTLEKESAPLTKSIGASTVELLVINAVVPFLFALSAYNKSQAYQERAMDLLEQLPPESNSVVTKFRNIGFEAKSALDSQGIIHLKLFECDPKKCLNCRVGIHLMKDYAGTD